MSYLGAEPTQQMPEVGTGTVETQDIKDGAVTTIKIADASVSAAKLAAGAAVPSQTSQSGKYLTTDGTTASWGTITPNLKITAVTYPDNDTAVDPVGAQTITITGVSFASTPTVYIGGTIAPSVTFVSSTTLTVTTPAKSAGTYDIYVVNPDGATAIRVYGISYSGVPTWTTAAGSLGDLASTWTVQLQAASNSAVTYALASGSTLPTGVTINSSGLITGTNITVEQTFNFSVVATDAEFQDTSRSFSVTITLSEPYFRYTTLLLTGDGINGAQNNTFLDSSTNNFTITRNGNTTQGSFSPYGSNWSNFFDGSGDYLTAPTPVLSASGNFTVECWINPRTSSSNTFVLAQFISGNSGRTGFGLGGSVVQMFLGGTTNNGTTNISYNTWTHLAFTRSGTTFKAYVNGTLDLTVTSSVSIVQENTTIGGNPNFSPSLDFSGYISNLRVTNTVVYTTNFTPSTTPLTAISGTQLLTCQSNQFKDNSTNNYLLAVNEIPSVQPFNPFGTATAYSTSVIGGSGYFDGSGDYLDTTLTSTLGTGNFTAECWFNNNDLVNQPIFSIGSYASGIDVRISESAPSKLDVICYGSFKNATFTFSNAWQHLAIVRNSGTTTIYLNGALFAAGFADTNNYLGNVLRIGGLQAGGSTRSHFLGYISNFRITNTAVYTTTFTPSTTPLTAISGTQFLSNMTNGAIFDNAMMNNLETVGNAQISTSVKKYGTGSMSFNGTNSYLTANYSPNQNFGTGNFTIEGWVYLNSLSANYYCPAGTWTTGTSDEWLIQISNANTIRFLTTAGTSFYSATITTSTWYHIAAVRNGSTITLYVNGTSVGSYTNTNSIGSVSKTLHIGAQPTPIWYWNGYIDDFRITKGYARYTANFTPPTVAHRLK